MYARACPGALCVHMRARNNNSRLRHIQSFIVCICQSCTRGATQDGYLLLANIPDVCTLLQTPIDWSRGAWLREIFAQLAIHRPNRQHKRCVCRVQSFYSLTFFCFLGYIRGNVWIISRRANTIKSDATCAELELMARNLKAKVELS